MNTVENTIEEYNKGNVNVLETYIALKEFKSFYESQIEIIKKFESENINEIELEIREHHNEFNGYKFEIRNGRNLYDFSKISEIQEKKKELKNIEAKYKLAFDAFQKGNRMIDDETGEVLELPTLRLGKSSIVLKTK